MGKASSAKKVARAARAGGRVSSGQPRSLLFPSILTLVVVLGVGLVAFARQDRQNEDTGGVPQIGDHIHQAIAFSTCGTFLPDLPQFESEVGIHTHADGVIHIHPFSQLGVGANATLERYFKDVRDGGLDASLSNSKLEYLGETYEEGETECEGVDDPILRVAYWENVQDEASEPVVTTGDFGDRRLTQDGAGITVFFGDPDADIPKPPHAPQLTELGAADGSQVPDESGSTTTTVADDSSSTSIVVDPSASSTTVAAGEPSDASSTTVAADATSTTVAP
jgi:hypothetical protein